MKLSYFAISLHFVLKKSCTQVELFKKIFTKIIIGQIRKMTEAELNQTVLHSQKLSQYTMQNK